MTVRTAFEVGTTVHDLPQTPPRTERPLLCHLSYPIRLFSASHPPCLRDSHHVRTVRRSYTCRTACRLALVDRSSCRSGRLPSRSRGPTLAGASTNRSSACFCCATRPRRTSECAGRLARAPSAAPSDA